MGQWTAGRARCIITIYQGASLRLSVDIYTCNIYYVYYTPDMRNLI